MPSLPSAKPECNSLATSTTWALVSANPSGVKRKTGPLPALRRLFLTRMCATAALASSATRATVAE